MHWDATTPHSASREGSAQVTIGGVAAHILALRGGDRLTLIGIDRDGVGDALRAYPQGGRSALLLESAARNAETMLDDLIDDLADLAVTRFPQWYGRSEMTADELIVVTKSEPRISTPWLRAAVKRAAAGHAPRFRRTAKQFEFVQLMQAVDACNPVLIAEIDPVAAEHAAPAITALEWCAGQGASVVAVLAARPPAVAPYDRILYGALDVVRDAAPAQARFITSRSRSRAHPASIIEQRIEAALRRDPELGPLFSCNEIVPIGGCGLQPRVDLLWREGRVVVELDGPEHQADPKFCQRSTPRLRIARIRLSRAANHQRSGGNRPAARRRKDSRGRALPPNHGAERLMTERLTPKQTLLVWCLLGFHGEALQSSIVPRVEAKDRKVLVTLGLISEGKRRNSIVLRAEDKGWRWASEHLSDELPANFRVLQQWLGRVRDFLAETDRPLAEFVGPPPDPLPEPSPIRRRKPPAKLRKPKKTKQASPVELRARIEAAYLAVTEGRRAESVPLSRLRAELSDLDRKTVDEGLLRILQGDDKARLGQISDPKALTQDERDAAFSPGGEPYHLIWIES